MPRPPSLIPTRKLHTAIPEPDLARLELHLFSELEGRVPHAAYSSFFLERIREFFSWKALDLAPWADSPPGAFVVRGPAEAIRALEKTLTELEIT